MESQDAVVKYHIVDPEIGIMVAVLMMTCPPAE
jgi:uncharacterized membrane protein